MKNAWRSTRWTPRASVRVAAHEAFPESQANDLDVEPEAPVLHVVQIELDAAHHLFDAVGFAAIAVDLRPPGDARLDPVAVHVALHQILVDVVVFERMRTRTHHRHLAAQHVDELRQLVEAGAPQERADRGDARVAARGLGDLAGLFLVHPHRTELVDLELIAVDALTL